MCGMKWLILSQSTTVHPLKFGHRSVISSHTLLGMWLRIHAGTMRYGKFIVSNDAILDYIGSGNGFKPMLTYDQLHILQHI